MLLRSISSHVRSQNWLAVALDFVIVVTGIFVGLQADAWNESRKERISERAAIEQLLFDFTTNGMIVDRMVEFHAEKVEELTVRGPGVRTPNVGIGDDDYSFWTGLGHVPGPVMWRDSGVCGSIIPGRAVTSQPSVIIDFSCGSI